MLGQKSGGKGMIDMIRRYVSTYGRRDDVTTPTKIRASGEEISALAGAIDRRMDRDGSYGDMTLLRHDGRKVDVAAASSAMCTVARGPSFVAADFVLAPCTMVDLNDVETGSVEVTADVISFRKIDASLVEIVTIRSARRLQ